MGVFLSDKHNSCNKKIFLIMTAYLKSTEGAVEEEEYSMQV
jgi:hypothetical protein